MSTPARIGVMLPRDLLAGHVIDFVQRAEQLGFHEVWVVEDLGYRGGIAQAAVALGCTTSIRIGVGILPAAARNVAFTAMEIATLEALHPGRLDVGIGHGVPDWMASLGIWPRTPLTFLDGYAQSLSALLRGDAVTLAEGADPVALDPSALPPTVPPIVLGVRGPRSLADDAQQVRARLDELDSAGTTDHVLIPVGDDPVDALDSLAGVLPAA